MSAQIEYGKNCVESLIEYIKADNHSIREKNSAVWALGQLADKRALTFLEGLLESIPEEAGRDKEKNLSRYEIEKAVKWCSKGNATSWMYKECAEWD